MCILVAHLSISRRNCQNYIDSEFIILYGDHFSRIPFIYILAEPIRSDLKTEKIPVFSVCFSKSLRKKTGQTGKKAETFSGIKRNLLIVKVRILVSKFVSESVRQSVKGGKGDLEMLRI